MNKTTLGTAILAVLAAGLVGVLEAQLGARDPGVRNGAARAGEPLSNLTPLQLKLFAAGKEDFEEAELVSDGLGPRFNLDSCGGCHKQPAIGGTSPATNPQIALATAFGANNVIPSFLRRDGKGPIREARFQYKPDGTRDGGVHGLFVISGRDDRSVGGASAAGCNIQQPDFERQVRNNNVIFRIPTPVFGAGLIEQIPDKVILDNQAALSSQKASLGIRGRPNRARIGGVTGGAEVTGEPNRSGNDGTITRFGWKAQNKSLLVFSGEAYNVEMGITNELFQTERDETSTCQFAPVPQDTTAADNAGELPEGLSGAEKFALFMRFLAPPTPLPAPQGSSIANGKSLFSAVGCAYCHTPTLKTGNSTVAALRNKDVNLYSDLLVHQMGAGLADDIIQGDAGPDEFRTAPLWGLGQRIFFLHDGRTKDLAEAIQAHWSDASRRYGPSEANAVINKYNRLRESEKQDMLDFLRSL